MARPAPQPVSLSSMGLLVALLVLSLWLPLPLYLLSLALFGLPHIVWEIGFLRSRYAARWPRRWWYALWAVLLAQAGMRGAAWLGSSSSAASQIADLLALALLAVIVALAPFRAGWRVRAAGLLIAAATVWLLEQGDILMVLVLLAMAHNYTPLAMVWDMARDHPPSRPLAWMISAAFALPVLVAASGWTEAVTPAIFAARMPLLDGQLPPQWGGTHRLALLSAIVLAQCLHYYCVIHLLPRAERRRTGKAVVTPAIRLGVLLAVALMLGYYAIDYGAARKLYAVAAGIHAWLEWPVLLMAFLCAADNGGLSRAAPAEQAAWS